MIIHDLFEPRWVRSGAVCGRDLGFGKACPGTLSVMRQRVSAWPAHQADPELAIVRLPSLDDVDLCTTDPSMGHRLGVGVCTSCSVRIPIMRSDVTGRPASLSTVDAWGVL
jgi:hypothetical protein